MGPLRFASAHAGRDRSRRTDVEPICIAKPGCHRVSRGGTMRRTELSRSPEEASGGVRNELLNRGSGVRVPAPAPLLYSSWAPDGPSGTVPYSHRYSQAEEAQGGVRR